MRHRGSVPHRSLQPLSALLVVSTLVLVAPAAEAVTVQEASVPDQAVVVQSSSDEVATATDKSREASALQQSGQCQLRVVVQVVGVVDVYVNGDKVGSVAGNPYGGSGVTFRVACGSATIDLKSGTTSYGQRTGEFVPGKRVVLRLYVRQGIPYTEGTFEDI